MQILKWVSTSDEQGCKAKIATRYIDFAHFVRSAEGVGQEPGRRQKRKSYSAGSKPNDFTIHYSLFTIHYSPVTIHHSPLTIPIIKKAIPKTPGSWDSLFQRRNNRSPTA
jgi:hypothetical protein